VLIIWQIVVQLELILAIFPSFSFYLVLFLLVLEKTPPTYKFTKFFFFLFYFNFNKKKKKKKKKKRERKKELA